MSEGETAESWNASAQVVPFPVSSQRAAPQVSFHRDELRIILNLYGRMVAEGEWRDYTMDFTREKAVFSIHRRTSERPLYRIEKDPRLETGRILKRGHDLAQVLRVLEKPLRVV